MLTGGSSTRQLITAPDDAMYTKYLGHPVSLLLLRLPPSLLPIAFTGQGLFDPEFLAWLQVKGVPLDFADNVLLQNLSLEAAEGVLHGFAILQHHLSQLPPPVRPDSSSGIIRPLPRAEGPPPGSVGSRAASTFPSVPCWA